MTNETNEIPVLVWHDVIRRRPQMYIGDTGRLGLRFLARGLFETPERPRSLLATIRRTQLALSFASVPISVRPRREDGPAYLVEILTAITVPSDDPPSVAPIEFLDTEVNPTVFRRGTGAPWTLALANALSCEMYVATRSQGIVTDVRFARGVIVTPLASRSTSGEDGVDIRLDLDPEVFGNSVFVFEDLANELRDFSLRRRVSVELRDEEKGFLFTAPADAG
jgi:hypothetical protein